MRYEREDATSELSDEARRALRAMYAPPADSGYWNALEARIMSRVATGADEWWSFFGGWTKVGLLAAGLAGLVAGLVEYRTQREAKRLAYQAVIEVPDSVRAELELPDVPGGAATREATLRYVFER